MVVKYRKLGGGVFVTLTLILFLTVIFVQIHLVDIDSMSILDALKYFSVNIEWQLHSTWGNRR